MVWWWQVNKCDFQPEINPILCVIIQICCCLAILDLVLGEGSGERGWEVITRHTTFNETGRGQARRTQETLRVLKLIIFTHTDIFHFIHLRYNFILLNMISYFLWTHSFSFQQRKVECLKVPATFIQFHICTSIILLKKIRNLCANSFNLWIIKPWYLFSSAQNFLSNLQKCQFLSNT